MANNVMTLHQLCDTLGISRRVIQGYEKHHLVNATGRNARGYLLYDSHMQEKIREIRQLQKFGFSVKDIQVLLTLPKSEFRIRLIAQKAILEQKNSDLKEQLWIMTELIKQLE